MDWVEKKCKYQNEMQYTVDKEFDTIENDIIEVSYVDKQLNKKP